MEQNFVQHLIDGNNHPPAGSVSFDSSDHIRFQNGQDVSGHNYGCNRRLVIEKNIEGSEGYTVTMYNMDGIHPIWKDNVQMAPKQMKIVNVDGNIVELRGYGYDENAIAMGAPFEAASFANYGIALIIEDDKIVRAQLNMYDRNLSLVYLKSFYIFVDPLHPVWLNIKHCIGDNVNAIEEINTLCENLNLNFDQIKTYAEQQAQDVHCPANRYFLESAVWTEGHEASYKVYVCFVQNLATEEVRAFVYDENQDGLNELIAEQINKDDVLKAELLSNCIRLECENNEETEMLEGEAVETAKAEISVELKEAEQQMILEEEEAEKTKVEVEEDNVSVAIPKVLDKNRLHKKALYDSLSFEIELQKIFKEDDPDEIWLISPWIKGTEKNNGHSVFLEQRGPAIETFLQDENKRVFVAYSAPSVTKSGKIKTDEDGNIIRNIDSDVLKLITTFEEQYPNFFFVELPEFHVKNVIEVKSEQQILFTGSFNVLSFAVAEGQTHIGREEMTLAHYNVARKKYSDYQYEFAEIYSERIRKQIMALDDSFAASYKNERLEYFLSIDNPEIKKLFLPIRELLEEKSLANVKRELGQKLAKIGQELVVASNMSGINPKDKKRITSALISIENEMRSNSIDDPSMLELLNNNKELSLSTKIV